MVELTLIRHGQASFGEENYDQLSDLGQQQSKWLGDHFKTKKLEFDRIIIGSQHRHRQTIEAVMTSANNHPEIEVHSGFNEYDFRAIYANFCKQYPQNTDKDDRRAFFSVLRKSLIAWSENKLEHPVPESWQDFETRIKQALSFSTDSTLKSHKQNNKQRVLIVTSGGPISMVMKQSLDLSVEHMININLQVINTSSSRFLKTHNNMHLLNFNSINHLDHPERAESITYS